MVTSIIIVFVLLFISAFFSAAETAMTAASKPLMHQLSQTGDPRAVIVTRLHNEQEQLIGAILLGNNVVNILATALTTNVLLDAFGDSGVVYATIVMTVLVLVFGEILPKTYAFRHANQVALTTARPIRMFVRVCRPLVASIQFGIRGIYRIFGVDLKNVGGSTAQELRGAIELHAAADKETVEQEAAMLHSILDLPDVWVSEVMIHRRNMVSIDAALPVREIVDKVLASPFTRIPLWRNEPDNIVGILHSKALLRAVHEHGENDSNLDIASLASPPWFIPDSTKLLTQLQAFRARKEHFAIVVDEYGSVLGIVTLEDILEEIVGDISDEHDLTVVGVRPHPDGSYTVQGNATLRDLNRQFGWDLPDDQVATIAGLLLHEARRIPEVGQVFTFHDLRFEVLQRRRNQITLLRLTPRTVEAPATVTN
jgi:Mg2+/Co2+ transporter CorB